MTRPSTTIASMLVAALCLCLSGLAATGCCRGSSDTGESGTKTKPTPTPAAAPTVAKTQAQIDACKAACNAKHKVPMERLQCYIPCN